VANKNMSEKIKIIFLGSPSFAIPSLKALIEDGQFKILAVITQPDKPAGRGQELTPPPIKKFAAGQDLEVWQPLKLKDIKDEIIKAQPDFLVVVAYGKLVPKNILNIPKYGCVNIHGSILPRYRGAAVIQAPILNGDTEAGVTIMLMDETLDTGPILKIERIKLSGAETAEDIHNALAELGAKTLPQTLIDLSEGKITPKPQDGQSVYVKEIKKEDGRINWSRPAIEIERLVRAFAPWPGTFSQLAISDGQFKIVKILSTEKAILPINKYQIGEVFLNDNKLAVQCQSGALIISKLQMEGGKPLSAEDFLRGHKDFIGKILK
jgi:methionyl-tRNA formyltransferase